MFYNGLLFLPSFWVVCCFRDSKLSTLRWSWGPGVSVHDSQIHRDDAKVSKEMFIHHIRSKLPWSQGQGHRTRLNFFKVVQGSRAEGGSVKLFILCKVPQGSRSRSSNQTELFQGCEGSCAEGGSVKLFIRRICCKLPLGSRSGVGRVVRLKVMLSD